MYIYIYIYYIYVYTCICIYMCVCICNHENNVPSRLSPQWLCCNSCTWKHDVRLNQRAFIFILQVRVMYTNY